MAEGTILGPDLWAVNAPAAAALQYLYHVLGPADLGGRYFILNGDGQTLPSSAHGVWTPERVAAAVRGGLIWVDITSQPMVYEAGPGPLLTPLGEAGWARFARAVGRPALARATTWAVPSTVRGYPYSYGFPLRAVGRVAGLHVGGTVAGGYASLLALTVGRGLYVYAAGSPAFRLPLPSPLSLALLPIPLPATPQTLAAWVVPAAIGAWVIRWARPPAAHGHARRVSRARRPSSRSRTPHQPYTAPPAHPVPTWVGWVAVGTGAALVGTALLLGRSS
jgi:hypothetical protein